jgi:hypothetical protein
MPKGLHPNSRKNLKVPTSEEARENGRKGGLKRAENCKMYNSFKEAVMDLSNQIHTNAKGQKAQGFEILGRKLFSMAQQGNIRAMELCMKLAGEVGASLDITTNGKDISSEPIKVEIIDKREQIEAEEE